MASPYESDFSRQKWADRVRLAGLVWSAAYLALVALVGLLVLVTDLIGKGVAGIVGSLGFYAPLGAVVWSAAIAVRSSRKGSTPNTQKARWLFRSALAVEAVSIAAVIVLCGVLFAMEASGVMPSVWQDIMKGSSSNPVTSHMERTHIVKGILTALPVNLVLFGFYALRGVL